MLNGLPTPTRSSVDAGQLGNRKGSCAATSFNRRSGASEELRQILDEEYGRSHCRYLARHILGNHEITLAADFTVHDALLDHDGRSTASGHIATNPFPPHAAGNGPPPATSRKRVENQFSGVRELLNQ